MTLALQFHDFLAMKFQELAVHQKGKKNDFILIFPLTFFVTFTLNKLQTAFQENSHSLVFFLVEFFHTP